jgi:DNA-binding GntR family transcriptional regulator
VEQSLAAVSLEPEEARLLRLPAGTAAFLLSRLSFTRDGPLAHSRYWLRGDRPVFVDAFEP